MLKRKIRTRMVAVALICIILTSLFILIVLHSTFQNKAMQELAEESDYVATAMNSLDDPYAYVADVAPKGANTRFTWVAADGTVLYENYSIDALENHLDRPEIMQALQDGYGSSNRASETLSARTLYYAVRLEDSSVIRLASTSRSIWGSIFTILPFVLIIILFMFILTYLAANRLTTGIIAPINKIDPADPLYSPAYDELSPLLNNMAKQNATIEQQIDALTVRERELDSIIRNMHEGFVLLDSSANILMLNDSASSIFGVEQSEVRGKPLIMLHRNMALQQAVKSAAEGFAEQTVLTLQAKTFEVYTSPVIRSGYVDDVIVFMLDITARNESESLRKEFTANVSHELKTPLTSIRGYAELMKQGVGSTADYPGFATRIYDETNRLIDLVDDIMQVSMLDEGGTLLEKKYVPLQVLTDEVLLRLSPIIEQKQAIVRVNGDNAEVYANESLLSEMLYNIIENAVKYNRTEGTVDITVSDMPGEVVYTVCDNGIGIPLEQQDKVFQRFYRVDKSHSKQTGGTGLGLSIVKNGALFHGAKVELESKEHFGTTIRLRFPKGIQR